MNENLKKTQGQEWDLVIEPNSSLLSLGLAEMWRYRDLILLFVRRDFVTFYKQTILGPAWFFIQPILTTVIFTFVFGNIAKIPTSDNPDIPQIPHALFYLSGIVLWNYFAECVNKTSNTFIQNANIFGKVYFPRAVVPLSIVISNLLKLSVQFGLFILVWAYFVYTSSVVKPNFVSLIFPVLVIIMAVLGLGIGMLISSMTTKYRDLTFLITFAIQLAMYASPVIYPLNSLPEKYKIFIAANPMTGIIETFRYGFLGQGALSLELLGYSTAFAFIILVIGLIEFNRVQRSFMDTV